VALSYAAFFQQGRFPPVVRVYAATIETGVTLGAARSLAAWAAVGAALQLLGGARRQLGILFATGLLIVNPAAGWAVLAGVLVRWWLARGGGLAEGASSTIFAAGLVAGDAVWAFVASMLG
jgi:hypothetical protein